MQEFSPARDHETNASNPLLGAGDDASRALAIIPKDALSRVISHLKDSDISLLHAFDELCGHRGEDFLKDRFEFLINPQNPADITRQLTALVQFARVLDVDALHALVGIESLSPQLNRLSAVNLAKLVDNFPSDFSEPSRRRCLDFCIRMAPLIKGGYPPSAQFLLHEFPPLWKRWGESEQVNLGELLVEGLSNKTRDAHSLGFVRSLFGALDEIETARGILYGFSKFPNFKDEQDFLAYVRSAKALMPHVWESKVLLLGTILAAAYSQGYGETVTLLIEKMITDGPGIRMTSLMLDFIHDYLNRASSSEISKLHYSIENEWQDWKQLIFPSEIIEDSPFHYLISRMLVGGLDSFNPWRIHEDQFKARWDSRIKQQLKPILHMDDAHTMIEMTPQGYSMQLKEGKTVDQAFLHKVAELYRPKSDSDSHLQVSQLHTAIGRRIPEATTLSPRVADVFKLLTLSSQRLSFSEFKSIAGLALPLLAPACGYNVLSSAKNAAPSSPDETYDFLESLRLLVDDGIVPVLLNYGMERRCIDAIKEVASLKKIKRELAKFEKVHPRDEYRIDLDASKNVLDEFYDLLAETCIWKESGSQLEASYFQPIRATMYSTREIIGCWYTLKTKVVGEESLILAGGGLRRAKLKEVQIDQLCTKLINELKRVCKKNGLGGLYLAVGQPKDGRSWSSEGRIGQTEEVENAMVPSNPEVIELGADESVDFPKDYRYGPIRRVIKL